MKKLILCLAFILIPNPVNAHGTADVYDLTMSFSLKNEDDVEIKVCNPTDADITFFDGIFFDEDYPRTDAISIEYNPLRWRTEIISHPFRAPVSDFMKVATEKKITAKTCLSKDFDVMQRLRYVQEDLNKDSPTGNVVIESFRVRVVLYEKYHLLGQGQWDGKIFESPVFELKQETP